MSVEQMALVWKLPEEVGSTCRLVLLALADHADADGKCWPSYARLMSMTGLSRRT